MTPPRVTKVHVPDLDTGTEMALEGPQERRGE